MTDRELDQVRAERDALLENDVDAWLHRLRTEGAAYQKFESSISFRVTAPIRWTGTFVRKVRSDGLGEALALAVAVAKRRVAR